MGEREPEKEREAEADAPTGSSTDRAAAGEEQPVAIDETAPVDDSVESFLTLEGDLADAIDADPVETPTYARVVDADKVDADAVPADYPFAVDTDAALALQVDLGNLEGRRATLFFEWPRDDRLDRLLSAAGVTYETFADLNGIRLTVDVEDGHYVPVVSDREPSGDPRGKYGVLGGLAFNLLTILGAALAPATLATTWFLLVFLLVNLLAIPASTYLDGRYLETHTDWDHAPSFWATLSIPPLVNVPVSIAYLWTRSGVSDLIE